MVVGDTDTWGGHKEYLNIILVSWVEGIAYREGMLSMLESDWLKMDWTWRQITLCWTVLEKVAGIDHLTSLAA